MRVVAAMSYGEPMEEDVAQAFKKVHTHLARHDNEFETLGVMLVEQFRNIDRRFEQIDRRFEQIDRRFEHIDRRFEHIDRRFEGVDERFETLADEIADRLSADMRRYFEIYSEQMRSFMAAFNEKLTGQQEKVQDHESRISRLERQTA
jgi:chromosome segregation ATPase